MKVTHHYRDSIVFGKLSFEVFSAHITFSNSFAFKSVFKKLRFRDGLVWTVDLTVEIMLRIQIILA